MKRLCTPALALSLVAALGAGGAFAQEDPLAALGARASIGAAPGYVADETCGRCHAEIYDSYQAVGMAQSFRKAGSATEIEAFGETYLHEPSQRYYRISSNGGRLVFHRHQEDADGKPINEIELPVSWVMGSGNRVRSYIHQTEWGEMFLLPLSWYSESGSWSMSPGFEGPAHKGVNRIIKRECMFCHNAYPEVESGSDLPYSPELFPADLPEGTGCQRCHGPGAGHISAVLAGDDIEGIRARIVNPGKLPAERRDEVCFQCHLLPSYLVSRVRRFDRSVYSYRPGQKLTDYLVPIDAGEEGVPERNRFEINHHGYRFYQSSCYRESDGALGCISCHNPHEKKNSASFRRTVSEQVCADCHESPAGLHSASTDFDTGECVTCHMPTTRTRDVVMATMTDHWIGRGPFDLDALVAPKAAEVAPITNVSVLPLDGAPSGEEGRAYELVAVLRANRSLQAATNALGTILRNGGITGAPALVEFANGSVSTGQFSQAERLARQLIGAGDFLPAANKLLGVSLMAQDNRLDSVAALKESLRLQPDPEVHFNLAAAYLRYGQTAAAEEQLRAAIELRPTLAVAWKYLGLIHRANGRRDPARQALARAVQLEPNDLQAYGDLIAVLREAGDDREADRYLELRRRLSQPSSHFPSN